MTAGCASAGGQGASRPAPAARSLDLRCLSADHSSCGCSLKVVSLSCPADRPTGGRAHFGSELNDGAPLWLNVGGREMSLRSRRPVTDAFSFGTGDRWTEEYDGDGDITVTIRYRPAKSTCDCPSDDGCEFFDVAADIVVTTPNRRPATYKGVGTCGC